MPPIIDPSISVILIKEVRAHFDVIKSIDSINHEGFRGISTLSYDGKLRNWTLELDLLGSIRLEHERIDKKWRFDLKGLNKKR